MATIKWILNRIDWLSDASGWLGKWMALVLIGAGTFETVSRHFFGAPTIWAYDTLSMAGGVMYLLGSSFDLKRNAHTRVDLIYGFLSLRGKAAMDIAMSLLLFFPLVAMLFVYSLTYTIKAWKINEVMFTSFWYPPAGPYRTIFTIGLLLLLLQGVAQLVRDIYSLAKGVALDQPES